MRRNFYAAFLILTLLASCSPRNQTAVPEHSLTLEDCALTSPTGNQVDARCGTLTVPEDRANPNARQMATIRGMLNERTLQPSVILEEHQ